MRIQELLYEAGTTPTPAGNPGTQSTDPSQQDPNAQTTDQNAITPAMFKAYNDRLTALEKATLQTASAAGVGATGQDAQQKQAVGTTPPGQAQTQPQQQQGQTPAPGATAPLPGGKPPLGQPQGTPMGQGPAPAPSLAPTPKPPPVVVPGGGNPKQALTKIQQSLTKNIAGVGAAK